MAGGTDARVMEVAAGLIWKTGNLLLCQRPMDKPMAGFWEFPGGKLERGETAAEALERELEEELGISASDISLYDTTTYHYANDNLTVILHFLTVGRINGDPAPREGQTMAWFTPREALKLPVLAADLGVLRHLATNSPKK